MLCYINQKPTLLLTLLIFNYANSFTDYCLENSSYCPNSQCRQKSINEWNRAVRATDWLYQFMIAVWCRHVCTIPWARCVRSIRGRWAPLVCQGAGACKYARRSMYRPENGILEYQNDERCLCVWLNLWRLEIYINQFQ